MKVGGLEGRIGCGMWEAGVVGVVMIVIIILKVNASAICHVLGKSTLWGRRTLQRLYVFFPSLNAPKAFLEYFY
jgi:hypothetical protein